LVNICAYAIADIESFLLSNVTYLSWLTHKHVRCLIINTNSNHYKTDIRSRWNYVISTELQTSI